MVFYRSLAATVVLASLFDKAFATTDEDSCHDLMDKATHLVDKSPGCALFMTLVEELDITDGASDEVIQDVCNAISSCNDDLSSLLLKSEEMGCKGWAPGENNHIDDIRDLFSDVTVFMDNQCENNVTQAVMNTTVMHASVFDKAFAPHFFTL